MAPAKKYTLYFNPTPQMTAFELASILLTMPVFDAKKPLYETGIPATESEWKRLPPPLRKYFVKDNPLADFFKPKPKTIWDEIVGDDEETTTQAPQAPAAPVAPPPTHNWNPNMPEMGGADDGRYDPNKGPKGPSRQPPGGPLPSVYGNRADDLIPEGQSTSGWEVVGSKKAV